MHESVRASSLTHSPDMAYMAHAVRHVLLADRAIVGERTIFKAERISRFPQAPNSLVKRCASRETRTSTRCK